MKSRTSHVSAPPVFKNGHCHWRIKNKIFLKRLFFTFRHFVKLRLLSGRYLAEFSICWTYMLWFQYYIRRSGWEICLISVFMPLSAGPLTWPDLTFFTEYCFLFLNWLKCSSKYSKIHTDFDITSYVYDAPKRNCC